MAEYIERQKVFDSLPIVTEDKTISLYGAVADFMVLVSTIPAADVVPVVHGRLIHSNFTPHDQCSICEKWLPTMQNFKYCPNCGARMDGE